MQLRKGGANLLGLCPFHNEKSPSFTVSPTKQFYHCFGCGAHGTALTFLMEHTGASFPEAVNTLASSVGMRVPEDQPRNPQQRAASQRRKEEVSRHQQMLDGAQTHYVAQLHASAQAGQYLKRRGLNADTIARFGLGWSGADRRGLAKVFPRYEDPLLVESGLVIESEDGRRYDRFRERVMFPIRNARGNLIGFGGRIIGKGEPKYLNSPETPLFSKGQELYGLWEGRQGIRSEGCVLVVEGYMDVVGLAQHGLSNAVATLGTSTTPDHVKKLMRASDRIVFSFDGDRAGRSAAWRALNACLPLLRDDVSIRFLFLPEGQDPDSYVQEFGQEAFRATLAEAMPLSRFMLDELAARHPMHEPEGRAACVAEAQPLLAQLPQGALRLQIEHEFARLVQFTPEELERMLQLLAQQHPQRHAGPSPTGAASRPGQPPAGESGAQGRRAHSGGFGDGIPGDAEPGGYDAAGWAPPDWVPHDAGYADDGFGMHEAPPAGMGGGGYASAAPGQAGAAGRGKWQGKGQGRRQDKGPIGVPQPAGASRAVTPLAKRLLRLLLAHPALVSSLGDQQLEILDHSPHLLLVRELVGLISASGAQHAGALLQAVQITNDDSDLADVVRSLGAELIGEDELPDPTTEWNDALRRIELESAKQEQSELVRTGLRDEASRSRYQELTRRIALLGRVASR